MKNKKPKIIVILGPTASGKSDLAVEIARLLNGEVVSADSRQVYKMMDIGTGKITKKEMKKIPHHLLDVARPNKRYDVSKYQKLAIKSVHKILKKGKLPIICGGTGLYIKAIVDNPSYPKIKPDPKLRKKLEKWPTKKLFQKLKKLDPKRAKTIDPKNPRRLIRALEILIKSGKKIKKIKNNPLFDAVQIGINIPQKKLRKKIKQRLQKRIKQGMVREVKTLLKNKVSFRRMEELGLEYRFVARYLKKEISKEQMQEQLYKAICRYAKRQMTWFKKDKRVVWISEMAPKKRLNKAVKIIKSFF